MEGKAARGVVHQILVLPNHNGTGWVIVVSSPPGQGTANLPQAQAEVIARLLASGPAEKTPHDPKPQPGDGPQYHDELAFWEARNPG